MSRRRIRLVAERALKVICHATPPRAVQGDADSAEQQLLHQAMAPAGQRASSSAASPADVRAQRGTLALISHMEW